MKYTNILITGSNGFIGSNLVSRLDSRNDINIFKYTRSSSLDDLKEYLIKCDIVFHFAGEVRPNSTAKEMQDSNTNLTKSIVDLLIFHNRRVPILYTSSIHAGKTENSYGKTKKESEDVIREYCKDSDVEAFIYRLPHIFGEGCKPNYNSVITTWIYNTINNLDIVIYDKEFRMTYVYVQDLIDDFVSILRVGHASEELIKYKVTLGYVLEKLNRMNRNSANFTCLSEEDGEFYCKLHSTYKSYLA